MTWAATAAPVVRQDVGALLEVAAEVAGDAVRRAMSQPFAVLMDHEGTITLRAVFSPPGEDEWAAVAALADTVQAQAAGLRAVLLVASCGTQDDLRARVFGDHREGGPFAAWLDYTLVAGGPARATSVEVEPMQSGLFG